MVEAVGVSSFGPLPRPGRQKRQKAQILGSYPRQRKLLPDLSRPARGFGLIVAPIFQDALNRASQIANLQIVGQHAILLAKKQAHNAVALYDQTTTHCKSLEPARRRSRGMADVGDTGFCAGQIAVIIVGGPKAIDDLQLGVRYGQDLLQQYTFIWMIGMSDRPREEQVQVSFAAGNLWQRRRQAKCLRKRRHRGTSQEPNIFPFTRIRDNQFIEELQPGMDRLNMEVVVRRLAENRAGQLTEIRRQRVPFDHLADIKIGWLVRIVKGMNVGIRRVEAVVLVKTDIHDLKFFVVLDPRQKIRTAGAAPGKLTSTDIVGFRINAARLRACSWFCAKPSSIARAAIIIPVDPACDRGVKRRLRAVEPG